MNPRKLQHLVEHLINEVIEHGTVLQSNDPKRVINLRFSGLPFCAVRWFANANTNLAPKSRKPFGYGFYTRIGTAVHEVFQETLLSPGFSLPGKLEIVADWRCTKCRLCMPFQVRPLHCSKCGGPVKFEEHEIVLKSKRSSVKALGHVDCILRLEVSPGVYVYFILDFKTTSGFKLMTPEKFKVSSEYTFQISSYAAAVSHLQSVNVAGTVLVFVARDSPHRFKVHVEMETPESKKASLKRLGTYLRQHEIAQASTTLEDLLPLLESRPCRETVPAEFSGCQYATMCAGSDSNCRKLLATSLAKLASSNRLPVNSVRKELP